MSLNRRSILDELNSIVSDRDKLNVIESRGNHIIKSALNLIELIQENFDEQEALDLQRRLINSIKGNRPERFIKGSVSQKNQGLNPMKINEVIIFEVDDETQAKRDAFADMDNKKKKKLKWNEIVANPDLTDLEFSVDGIDYKGYIDNKKNIFFVYDQALNDFVPADRNFTRRAFGKNISARIKNLLNLKPGGMEYIKNFFSFDNRGDPSLPGAGQAAKSTNLGGLIGSRIGGLIDRGLDKLRGKK